MDGPPRRLRDITGHDHRALENIRELYGESFPANERKPESFIREAADRDDYSLLAMIEGPRVVAFAIVYRSADQELSLLEYMATAPDRMSRGLGSAVFKEVAARNMGRVLILEVEAEESSGSSDAPARRRKSFYRNLGCRQLQGLNYRMPKVSSTAPPPMHLLVVESRTKVKRNTIGRWLEDIFRNVYGVIEPEQAVQSMLSDCPESIPLV
ncbi:MAG TPA: GNAT family N-acetyltransferase [Allosphingosinicella sp.]